jgi:dihydropteroate synthase
MDTLRCGRFHLPLARPLIMGILNLTPDSFSDGGRYASSPAAIDQAKRLADAGADIVDLGGESTRPGAVPVELDEELRRVIPVLEGLSRLSVPVSIDTTKPEVMRRAIIAGASMVNDVNALEEPGAIDAIASSQVCVCLMHKKGTPQNMQIAPEYDNVVAEVQSYLKERLCVVETAGVPKDRIVIDPGFGFGKNTEHNLLLLKHLKELKGLGVAVLVGLSRKSVLGKITQQAVGDRLYSSIAAALIAVMNGANIVRVHDVSATRDALEVFNSVERA